MPYYHVRITQRGKTKDSIELNLSEKNLVRLILEKYRLRGKFACGNELVNPADVLGMKITKSEQPLALDHPDYFRLEYRDLWRKVEDQEDVTKKFIEFIQEPTTLSRNVFIVHGRDYKPLKELKAMLTEFGLNPIVLHEQPSGSRTIVEKLEKYSDVGYAFVILTPEDVFVPKTPKETDFIKKMRETGVSFARISRARQNVILEFGYFMGLLGRDRVCCLYKGDVELPSDMHGIVYIPFKESINEVRNKIIKELKAAGYKIKVKKQRKEDRIAREKLKEIRKEVKEVLNRLEQYERQ